MLDRDFAIGRGFAFMDAQARAGVMQDRIGVRQGRRLGRYRRG